MSSMLHNYAYSLLAQRAMRPSPSSLMRAKPGPPSLSWGNAYKFLVKDMGA